MQRSLLLYKLYTAVLLWSVPLVLVSAVVVLWNAIPQLRALLANTVSAPMVTCGCETLFSVSNHPYLTAGLIIATTVSTIILGRFSWLLVEQYLRSRSFINDLLVVTQRVLHLHGRNIPVCVVRYSAPLLCTVGLLHPRIIISLTQLRLLNAVELRAAFIHEQMHIRFGHVWKRFILHAFIRTIIIIPSLRSLLDTVDSSQELQADEATLSVASRHDVLSALTRCLASRSLGAVPQSLPLFATADLRLQHLLSLPLATPLLRPILWAIGGIAALMVSSLFFSQGLFLAATAQTNGSQHVAACMQEFEDVVESPSQSIAPEISPTCVLNTPPPLWLPTPPTGVDSIFLINYTP